jgi:hypothetical protein
VFRVKASPPHVFPRVVSSHFRHGRGSLRIHGPRLPPFLWIDVREGLR